MNVTLCKTYIGASKTCKHYVFTSADGSTRCRGCHLHPDACTCGQMLRILRTLGIIVEGTP